MIQPDSRFQKTQNVSVYELLFLTILSAAFYLINLGKGSLASWDEAIYATVAKEIFRSGHWFSLTLEGSPWADKPPLCIWFTSLFYKLFGLNEFSARFFSCLLGIGTVLVTYFLGTSLFGRWIGFISALVLMSSSHFIHFSRFGMMDVPVTFFISLALYFFWLGREKNRYLIFSGIAVGLAVMTKSFAALIIFPITWITCWWASELKILGRSSYWIGVILAVVIALPWHLYETFLYHGLYLHDAVEKHLFFRTTKALDGHSGNFYFYIRTMVNKYHPWTLVSILSAPLMLFQSFRLKRKEFIFTSVWIFVIFGVITAVQTKLDWYILPLYPALSLSVGYYLEKIFKERNSKYIQALFLIVMALHTQYSDIFNHDYSREIKGIAADAKPIIASADIVYLYNFHDSPAGNFYLEKKIAYLDNLESFAERAKIPGPFFCFIHDKDLRSIEIGLPAVRLTTEASFENFRLIAKSRH